MSTQPRPPVHSVSSCRAYERCPAQYRFGYLERVPPCRPAPRSWRFGSAVHYGLEAAYRHRQRRGGEGPLLDCLPAAVASLHHAFDELQLHPARMTEAVVLVTRALVDDRVASGDILGVECWLGHETACGTRVGGYPDLVVRVDTTTLEIREHKVTRVMRSPDQLRADLQLNLYGWLARRRWPWAQHVVAAHHYPLNRVVVRAALTDRSMRHAFDHVEQVAATIAEDAVFEPKPGAHCRWCEHAPRCPAAAAA